MFAHAGQRGVRTWAIRPRSARGPRCRLRRATDRSWLGPVAQSRAVSTRTEEYRCALRATDR
eukprot:1086178-Pleurochrysis_carterae.AAC.1